MGTTLRIGTSAAALALLLGACGDNAGENLAEQLAENAAGGDVDIDIDEDGDSGSISVENSDGSVDLSFGGDIPDGFPDNLDLVDGEILSGTRIEDTDDNQVIYAVHIQIDDGDVDAIISQVRQALLDAGFEITFESDQAMGEGRVAGFQVEGNGFTTGNVSILEGDGEISVGYTFAEPIN